MTHSLAVQDVFAVSFRVEGDDLDAVFRRLVIDATTWAWRGSSRPPAVLDEASGRASPREGYELRWETLEVPERPERASTIELRHDDDNHPTLEWSARVDLCRGREDLRMVMRLAREARELTLAPASIELRRPRLVTTTLQRYPCWVGDQRIETDPATLLADDVQRFVNGVLQSPNRRLPVIVFSLPSGMPQPGGPDPTVVADEVAGFAHVYVLGSHLAWQNFREAVGDGKFVPLGGVRMYWPGFPGRHHHPYWTRRGLAGLPQPFERRTFGTLARLSVVRVPRDPLFSQLGAALAEHRRAEATRRVRQAKDAEEMSALFEEALLEAERERDTLRRENDRLSEELRNVSRELELQRESWAVYQDWQEGQADLGETGGEESAAPEDWTEFVELVELLESEAFKITQQAKDHLLTKPYPDPARMWRFLESLAQAAEAYRAAEGRVGDRLADWVHHEHGIEIALQDSGLGGAKFEFEGREYDGTPHVKVDDFVDPASCGRIYFAYDSQEPRFIVHHIGLHL